MWELVENVVKKVLFFWKKWGKMGVAGGNI